MKIRILGSLGAILAASFCSLAQAGTINFDDLLLPDDDFIPPNYADHGLGGNGDAHVGVAYRSASNNTNVLAFWTTGYGDLTNSDSPRPMGRRPASTSPPTQAG